MRSGTAPGRMAADRVAEGSTEPTKYWISTLPANTTLKPLVKIAKHRWIIERDYEELKQELGLGHFEGRGWRGFHHHATLCIAAYGFLVAERNRFSPSARAGHLGFAPPNRHKASARAARRVRPERHNPHSIATLRIILARHLARATASLSLLRIALRIIFGVHVRLDYAGCRTRMVGGGSPQSVQQFHS